MSGGGARYVGEAELAYADSEWSAKVLSKDLDNVNLISVEPASEGGTSISGYTLWKEN